MQEETIQQPQEETNALNQQPEQQPFETVEQAESGNVENAGTEQPAQQASTEDDLPVHIKERLGREKHKREKTERELAQLRATIAQMQQNPAYNGYTQPQAQVNPQMPQSQPSVDMDPVQQKVVETLTMLANVDHQRKAQQVQAEREMVFQTALLKAADTYDDFDDVVRDPSLPLSQQVLDNVKRFSNAPDVIYKLAKNRDELIRIANLHPDQQLDAIADMSASLKASSKNVVSKAPAPLSDVKGTVSAKSTTAKDPASRSIDEIRAEIRKTGWGRGRK